MHEVMINVQMSDLEKMKPVPDVEQAGDVCLMVIKLAVCTSQDPLLVAAQEVPDPHGAVV